MNSVFIIIVREVIRWEYVCSTGYVCQAEVAPSGVHMTAYVYCPRWSHVPTHTAAIICSHSLELSFLVNNSWYKGQLLKHLVAL